MPLHISGEVAAGLPRLSLRELEISCLPGKVPAQITVDVCGMKPGESITVSDLQVPRGVNVLTGPDVTVVTVMAPEEEAVDRVAGKEDSPEAAG